LAVTQLMREAHLPALGMTLLRAVETQIAGRCPSSTSPTTPAPRLARIT